MTCNFESELNNVELDFDYMDLYEKIVETFCEIEKCPFEVTVDLLYTDDDNIKEINTDIRNIENPTDVLSFPMNFFENPGDYSMLEEDPDAFDPDSGELMLGDIVLSQDHILRQAKEYGHSVKREFSFLIVHSLLHLTGYDHMEDDERIVMEERQKVIMEALGISR